MRGARGQEGRVWGEAGKQALDTLDLKWEPPWSATGHAGPGFLLVLKDQAPSELEEAWRRHSLGLKTADPQATGLSTEPFGLKGASPQHHLLKQAVTLHLPCQNSGISGKGKGIVSGNVPLEGTCGHLERRGGRSHLSPSAVNS